MRSMLIEGAVLTAISVEQAISLIGRGGWAPSVWDTVATGGWLLCIKGLFNAGPPARGWSVAWSKPKMSGETDCPHVGLTCPGPQDETLGLTYPCPSSSALPLYYRVAGQGAEGELLAL